MAAGQGSSMLYPVRVERRAPAAWWPILAAAGSVAVIGLAWWLWPRPVKEAGPAPAVTAPPPAAAAAPPPGAAVVAPAPVVRAAPAEAPLKPAAVVALPKLTAPKPAPVPQPVATAVRKAAPAAAASPPAAAAAALELGEASPKDMPAMSIAGYIRDDQAGSMAMINDKLVREGEEVAPGLRLEKILSEGAIFSYKGQRFRR